MFVSDQTIPLFSWQDAVHFVHVFFFNSLCCPIVDSQCVPGQAMLLLEPCIKHIEPSCKFCRNSFYCLLEEVPGTLKFAATIPQNKPRQVGKPYVVHMRPIEDFDASFIDFEGILKVFALLQKRRIAENQGRSRNFQFESCIIGCTGRRSTAKTLLKIDGQ